MGVKGRGYIFMLSFFLLALENDLEEVETSWLFSATSFITKSIFSKLLIKIW